MNINSWFEPQSCHPANRTVCTQGHGGQPARELSEWAGCAGQHASPVVTDSSTKAVMAVRSLSRQGMVRGVAVRASSAWARAMGDASSPCRLLAGISPAPRPDKASLCASTHSLPPCKTAGAAVYCYSDSTASDVLLQAESVVAVLLVGWQRS